MSDVIFSVVMPAFNAASTLNDSINSVLRQTFRHFELLVVDDCSSDATRDIIAENMRKDARVLGFFLDANGGISAARNVAIKAATGHFIAFLDADDLWVPEKLQKQYHLLSAGRDLVFASYIRFDKQGRQKRIAVPSTLTYNSLLNGNCIGNLTGVYNCRKLGKFYQEPIKHEDYLMWLQILRAGAIVEGVNEVLALYRVSDSSVSADKLRAAGWQWTIYREHLGLGALEASYRFVRYMVAALFKRA